jgi:Protein of unknown function (DUF2961)
MTSTPKFTDMKHAYLRFLVSHKILPFVLFMPLLLITSLLKCQEIYQMPAQGKSRISSFENMNGTRGAGGLTNRSAKGNPSESLAAGETKVLLDIHEAGMINRMWFTINNRSALMLRSLRFRMYWDDQAKPAVDVPFGDFFCAALGIPVAFQSSLFTNPEGRSFNSYIPMPFKKGARITLTNESSENLALLFYDIDFTSLSKPPEDMLYLHSCWNRSMHGALGKDFELLPAVHGRGRFLGVSVGVNVDSSYIKTWWGEGEVKMYLDGDSLHPTINGTGTEDYIGTGWGMGKFTNMFQGCTLADDSAGKFAFYRFHIPDPVYFHQGCRVTIQEMGGGMYPNVKKIIENRTPLQMVTVTTGKSLARLVDSPLDINDPAFPQGWINFYRVDDYSATAYFYLDQPVSNLPELASVRDRIK